MTTPPRKPRGRSFSAAHQPRGRPWTPAEVAALGSAPDGAVAARLGRSRASVIAKRRELGIPPAARPGRPPRRAGTPVHPTTGEKAPRSKKG